MIARDCIFCFAILFACSNSVYCQVIDKILAANEEDRLRLVVAELESNARLTADKVLDVVWTYSGKFPEPSPSDPQLGGALKHRVSGKLHFVMGQNRFWGWLDSPQLKHVYDAYQYTSTAQNARIYKLMNGRILDVEILCDYHTPPESDIQFYSDLFHCPPWRNGHIRLTPQRFQEFIASGIWDQASDVQGNNAKEIRIKRRHRGFSDRGGTESTYCFRETHGHLVFVRKAVHTVSRQRFGVDEYDVIHDHDLEIKYATFNGFLLPSESHHTSRTHSVNLDGTPYKTYKPTEVKNVSWRLQSCKVLDQFPERLLDIPIPASARIVDHCRNQTERKVHTQLSNSGWTRTHWLFVGGVMCCVGAATLWYRRRRQ